MSVSLSSAMLRHISRVRSNPALAVAPEELAELERMCRDDLDGAAVAELSPTAPFTWTTRAQLITSEEESQADMIQTFGVPVEIVGFFPSLIAIEGDPKVLPPLAAIDVEISRTKGDRRNITSGNTAADNAAANLVRPTYSSLASVSSTIANRLVRWRIRESQALLSFRFRWVPNATIRTAMAYSNVIVSLELIYRLLSEDERY